MGMPSSPTSLAIAWDREGSSVQHPEPWGLRGVFTTMRVEGEPPLPLFLEPHLTRIEESAQLIGLEAVANQSEIRKKLTDFIRSSPMVAPYLIRICLFENCLGLSCRLANPAGSGIIGKLLRHKRPLPEAKSTAEKELYGRLNEINLSNEDFILVNPENELVLESATSNLVFSTDNRLLIPENEILPGIVLGQILTELTGFQVRRGSPSVEELNAFEEIILCGSGREVANLQAIPEIGWQRRSNKVFLQLTKTYEELKRNNE